MVRACIAAALLLACAATAGAQDRRSGVIGRDDRVRVTEGGAWDAVGQVNVGGHSSYGQCSGTLIAPDKVLTAAHCVMDSRRGKLVTLRDLHFLAGVNGPGNKGHGEARCVRFPEGHVYEKPGVPHPAPPAEGVPINFFFNDVAVIILKAPMTVAPLEVASGVVATPGLELIHAAYPADRRYALTVHFGCQLLRADRVKPLWRTDCDTHAASSGGPVFVKADGKLKVAAVMLGAGDRRYTIALPSSVWRDFALQATCPE